MERKVETQRTIADYLTVENPKVGFLAKVDELINWKPIETLLKKKYRRTKDATGEDAYPALMMFKAMLLQRWYNLSDPALEAALYDRISFMQFCGLSVSSAKPDETTFCRFRNALIRLQLDTKLLDAINQQFEKSGLLIRSGAIVDATVVQSSRRPKKKIELLAEDRKEDEVSESGPECKINFSDDEEAGWIKKMGTSTYGFKGHVMVDAQNGFYLGAHTTAANRFDGKELGRLLEENSLLQKAPVFADKAYWSLENRNLLKAKGLFNGLMKKAVRGKPLNKVDKLINQLISTLRYKVERGLGTLKKDYGLARARYLGTRKLDYEFAMSGLCFNIKKAINLSF